MRASTEKQRRLAHAYAPAPVRPPALLALATLTLRMAAVGRRLLRKRGCACPHPGEQRSAEPPSPSASLRAAPPDGCRAARPLRFATLKPLASLVAPLEGERPCIHARCRSLAAVVVHRRSPVRLARKAWNSGEPAYAEAARVPPHASRRPA